MRISDWSSDVCSSDLACEDRALEASIGQTRCGECVCALIDRLANFGAEPCAGDWRRISADEMTIEPGRTSGGHLFGQIVIRSHREGETLLIVRADEGTHLHDCTDLGITCGFDAR